MAASVSPTAHLLRTSRLFSLPPRLKKPSHTTSISSTIDAFSPTATLPFPSQAAIETTPASLVAGDWGLKRPLPLKSTTNTTTPIIRVSAIDNIDHITDFESAADHTLSLRKWQEMHIPMTVLPPQTQTLSSNDVHQPFRSVYELRHDQISEQTTRRTGDSSRWKFGGPWLAGQTEGEFQDYVKKTIRRKRAAFRVFFKPWIENMLSRDNALQAMQQGKDQPPPVRLSESEFEKEIVELRHRPNRLYKAIWEFLDLPGSPPPLGSEGVTFESDVDNYLTSKAAEQGPPATHPAAGISYLRASAHMPNHPILGPQASKRPVQSRVLRAKNASKAVKRNGRPAIGVGGFVSTPSGVTTFAPTANEKDAGWNNMDPDTPGGSKVWVFPEEARVDSRGRIKFEVRQALPNEIAIWEGQQDSRYKVHDFPSKEMSMEDVVELGPFAPRSEGKQPISSPSKLQEQRARLPERRQDMEALVGGLR